QLASARGSARQDDHFSRIRVTGPSFTSSTSIIAPNSPVSTRVPLPAPRSLRRETNRSYNGTASSGGAASMKLGRRPFCTSPYSVNWDTTNTAPCTSASARFILPSASPNTRRPSSLSAIQASVSPVSEGANPARTRNPTPIFPVTRPPTRTSARETRCTTTLTLPPAPNAECGMRNAELQGRGRSRELAPRLDGRAIYSALRIPHSAFDSPFRTPHSALCSFHRHALRQVPRLIHVTAPAHRDVVRQELQRKHGQHGRQQVERLGHFDLVVGQFRQSRVSFRDHGEHAAAARLHLFHVGHDLLVDRVLRREEDHRHEVIDQRDRAVLHLGRGVTLRVDVGDLLELEGPFERHREVVAAAEVEDVARPHHALGDPLHL